MINYSKLSSWQAQAVFTAAPGSLASDTSRNKCFPCKCIILDTFFPLSPCQCRAGAYPNCQSGERTCPGQVTRPSQVHMYRTCRHRQTHTDTNRDTAAQEERTVQTQKTPTQDLVAVLTTTVHAYTASTVFTFTFSCFASFMIYIQRVSIQWLMHMW